MSRVPVLDTLETSRLILRRRRVDDAVTYRQLWTERDPRVPTHRQIDPEGRPTVEDTAGWIRAQREESGPGVLGVERKDTAEVIGYCGVVFHGNGSPDEPEKLEFRETGLVEPDDAHGDSLLTVREVWTVLGGGSARG